MRKQLTGTMIAQAAADWIGVKYVHDGRLREAGVDCAGLMVVVLRDLGEDPQDQLGLGRWDDYEAMCAAIEKECDLVWDGAGQPDLQPGDCLVFRSRAIPNHSGIYFGEGSMIHAHQGLGRVVLQPLEGQWETRLVRVYRYRGLA